MRSLDGLNFALSASAASLMLIQFVPVHGLHPQPVAEEKTLERRLQPPQRVSDILHRACRDCHSHETQWPWYSRVAPVSWWMAQEVDQAREALNFSEWSAGESSNPRGAAVQLSAACADVRNGRMPLPWYRTLHPEARLTAEDIELLCAWTREQARMLAPSSAPSREGLWMAALRGPM